MSDMIAVINHGRIVQIGAPEDIHFHPSDREVAKFVGRANWLMPDSMVRPEQVWLNRRPEVEGNMTKYTMKVDIVKFTGENYEVHMSDGAHNLMALSPKGYPAGERVAVHIDEPSMLRFG